VFTRECDAREHFGDRMGQLAGCQIKGHENDLLGVIRELQRESQRHLEEDTQVIRAMQSLKCEHAEALRRAEESGYNRGVRDMKALAEAQFGSEVLV
jgi:hypothetical protein